MKLVKKILRRVKIDKLVIEHWVAVPNDDVQNIWECTICGQKVWRTPDMYERNGLPYCSLCKERMKYEFTQVRKIEL